MEQLAIRTQAEIAAQINVITGFLDNQNHAFAAKEADVAKNNAEMLKLKEEEIANLFEKLGSQRIEMEVRQKKTEEKQEELQQSMAWFLLQCICHCFNARISISLSNSLPPMLRETTTTYDWALGWRIMDPMPGLAPGVTPPLAPILPLAHCLSFNTWCYNHQHHASTPGASTISIVPLLMHDADG